MEEGEQVGTESYWQVMAALGERESVFFMNALGDGPKPMHIQRALNELSRIKRERTHQVQRKKLEG